MECFLLADFRQLYPQSLWYPRYILNCHLLYYLGFIAVIGQGHSNLLRDLGSSGCSLNPFRSLRFWPQCRDPCSRRDTWPTGVGNGGRSPSGPSFGPCWRCRPQTQRGWELPGTWPDCTKKQLERNHSSKTKHFLFTFCFTFTHEVPSIPLENLSTSSLICLTLSKCSRLDQSRTIFSLYPETNRLKGWRTMVNTGGKLIRSFIWTLISEDVRVLLNSLFYPRAHQLHPWEIHLDWGWSNPLAWRPGKPWWGSPSLPSRPRSLAGSGQIT